MLRVLALLSLRFPKRSGLLLSRLLDSFSLRAREWLSFGRALDFDKAAIAGADDVHVHFGARVLLIFQIKQRRSVNDPDADGGDFGDDWRPLDSLFSQQLPAGNRESDIRAGDGRSPSAAVGLQDVAVDRDSPLAEQAAIRNRAQAAANQSLNLVRPSRRFAAGNLASSARMGGPRQHRVLCRDPAFRALAAQMRRQFFL